MCQFTHDCASGQELTAVSVRGQFIAHSEQVLNIFITTFLTLGDKDARFTVRCYIDTQPSLMSVQIRPGHILKILGFVSLRHSADFRRSRLV